MGLAARGGARDAENWSIPEIERAEENLRSEQVVVRCKPTCTRRVYEITRLNMHVTALSVYRSDLPFGWLLSKGCFA